MALFEKVFTASVLLASVIFVASNINIQEPVSETKVFVDSGFPAGIDLADDTPVAAPLLIEKVIAPARVQKIAKVTAKQSQVRDLAGVSFENGERNDDIGQLNEGKYSYEGLTFHVSDNGSVCHYADDEVNGTLVTEYIYDTRIKNRSKSECL